MTSTIEGERIDQFLNYDLGPRYGEDWPKCMGRLRDYQAEAAVIIQSLRTRLAESQTDKASLDGLRLAAIDEGVALKHELAEKEKELAEAAKLIYVPGVWWCAKCKLRIIRSNLNANTGTITANNSPDECSNCSSPLWRFSERQERKDWQELFDKEFDKAEALKAQLEAIRKQTVEECLKIINGWLEEFAIRGSTIKHVSAQKWANDAILDIRDGIRALSQPSAEGGSNG